MIASRRISRKLNSEHATHAPIDEFADTLADGLIFITSALSVPYNRVGHAP